MTKALVPVKNVIKQIRLISDKQSELVDRLMSAIEGGEAKDKILELTGALQASAKERAIASRFGNILLGQVFILFKEKWESLPQEFTQNYAGPYKYIYEVYGFGEQMADMYMEVWDALLSGRYPYKVPSFVDVTALSVVRLQIAAKYIIAGKMSTRRWKVIATKQKLDRAELVQKMEKGLGKPVMRTRPTKSSSSFFNEDTGDIQMYVDGKLEQVGFLNVNAGSPVITSEVNRIRKAAEIKRLR